MLGIMYLIFSGVQADFQEARGQIHEEAVRSVQKKRAEHLAQQRQSRDPQVTAVEVPHPALNQEIFKAPTQVASIKESRVVDAPADIMVERIGNDEFWCRDNVEPRKEKKPVKCAYPSACYGCVASSVIPAEAEGVIPFCDNGRQAEIFSIECCPSSVSESDFECPGPRECLHADAVPESHCSCDNRPDCRYIEIGGKIQCLCIK